MSILEILENHRQHDAVAKDTRFYCLCGWVSEMPRYRYGLAEHRAHVAQVLEQHEREREAQWRQLVRDMVDPDPCYFDHHGGCQAHGYLSLKPGELCPHAEAKQLLGDEPDGRA